jgi:hypothetical protein
VILGNTTHKTMGKNLVLYGNRRYNCFDDSLCTNKGTKSNYKRRALTINGVGYSYRNIPGGTYNNHCNNIDENKEQYIQVKGNS